MEVLYKTLSTGLLDNLAISADGDGTKESFELLRPPGKFEILIDFIRSARGFIDKHNIKTTLQWA